MLNIEEIKQKIITTIEQRGPSLPVHLAREIKLTPIFTSAILAELVNEQRVKLSNLKIGASPLYLLPNQNEKLEDFQNHITGIEKTALLKLKQNKILNDEIQEPSIRVALRSIRDFAIPLRFQEKIHWKYFTIPNDEAQRLLKGKPTKILKATTAPKITEPQHPSQQPPIQKPLINLKQPKPKKQKPPFKFLEEVKEFLLKKDIEFLQEISSDKKQVVAKIRINSDIGKLSLLLIAKDKKRITKTDITLAYQNAVDNKMPCLFISHGEPSKKTQEFLEDYKEIVRVERIG